MKTCKLPWVVFLSNILLLGSSVIWSQQAKNVVLAGFVSTEKLYGLSTSFPYATNDAPLADLWGWTYISDEFALVCLGNKGVNITGSGLVVVKVTDPNNAQIIKTIKRGDGSNSQNGPRDVRTFGNYAFVASDLSFGPNFYVNLVEALNSPSDPFAGVDDFTGFSGERVHNLHINTTQQLLFLSDLRTNQPVRVFKIDTTQTGLIELVAEVPVDPGGFSPEVSTLNNIIYSAEFNQGVTLTSYTYSDPTFTYGTQRNHN